MTDLTSLPDRLNLTKVEVIRRPVFFQHHRDAAAQVGVIHTNGPAPGQPLRTIWYADFLPNQTFHDFRELQKAVNQPNAGKVERAGLQITREAALSGWPLQIGELQPVVYGEAPVPPCDVYPGNAAVNHVVLALGWHESRRKTFNLGAKASKEFTKGGVPWLIKALRQAGHAC